MRYFITFYTFIISTKSRASGVILTTSNNKSRNTEKYLIARMSDKEKIGEYGISIIQTAEISKKEFERISDEWA